MRYKQMRFSIIIILIIFCSGCRNKAIRNDLALLGREVIRLPEKMICFQNKKLTVSPIDQFFDSVQIKLIVFHAPNSCSQCIISHLDDYQEIYDLEKSSQFSPMMIFAPHESKYEALIQSLEERAFTFPVYIDREGCFETINSFIPDDSRYHTFLLDRNNHVVLVGDPLASEAMWSLFRKTLDNMLANDGVYVSE